MTGADRLGAALEGRVLDRKPFTLTLPLYGARLIGARLEEYFGEPESYRRGQEAVAERWDPDLLFGPFALAFEARAWGARLAWTDRAPPNVKSPAGTARELLSSPPPDPRKDEGLSYLVESVGLLAREFSASKPIAAIITSPSDLPAILLGFDAWLDLFLFDPPGADRILELCERHFLALGHAFFDAGAAFLAIPSMLSNPKILPIELVRERVLPYLGRVFARLEGPVVFHHGANPLAQYLPLVKDLPGIAGFALDERDDIVAARSLIGPGRMLLAGLTGPLMALRSKEQIMAHARSLLARAEGDPSFAFSTSAADIPLDTPPENLDALVGVLRGG